MVVPNLCACKGVVSSISANWANIRKRLRTNRRLMLKSVSEASHVSGLAEWWDGPPRGLERWSVGGGNASVAGRSHRDWSCVGGRYLSYYWADWCGRLDHVLSRWAGYSPVSSFHSDDHCKKQTSRKQPIKKGHPALWSPRTFRKGIFINSGPVPLSFSVETHVYHDVEIQKHV